jgi:hypothetical protein
MQARQPSLGAITLVYVGYHLAIAITLNIAIWALQRFGGMNIEANAVSWLPLILGAMYTGQYYGRKVGAKPPQSYAWLAGLVFTLVSIILSVVVVYVAALVMGLDLGATLGNVRAQMGDDLGLIAGIIGVVLVLIWVVQRFMFSAGAAGAIKQAARLAARAAAKAK